MKLSSFSICATLIFLTFSPVISEGNYQGKPVQVKYKCNRGKDVVVEYSADGKTATLLNPTPGASGWALTAQPVDAGFHFKGDAGVEVKGATYDNVEIRPGSARTFKQCVAIK